MNGMHLAAIAAGIGVVIMMVVQRVTRPRRLARIATQANNWHLSLAAVGRLTDRPLLTKIAIETKSKQVGCAAVEKISDQSLLARITIEFPFASRTPDV